MATAAAATAKKPSFPLPAGYFKCPPLSQQEFAHLMALGKESSRAFIQQTENLRDYTWQELGKKSQITLYKGTKTSAPSAPFLVLRAVGDVAGTLEEVASMHQLSNADTLQQFLEESDDILDLHTLYDITADTRAMSSRYLTSTLQVAVRWMAMKVPTAATAFMHPRDFCYLETQDYFTDAKGRRGWAISMDSMAMDACCPAFGGNVTNIVRGKVQSSGYSFVESETQGMLHASHWFQVDYHGKIPVWIQNLILKGRVHRMIHFNTRMHEHRLKKVDLLAEFDVRRTSQSHRTNCFICRKKFRLLSRKITCRKCGEVVCSNCQHTWDIVRNDKKRKVSICNMCTSSLRAPLHQLTPSSEGSLSTSAPPPHSFLAADVTHLRMPRLARHYSYDEFMHTRPGLRKLKSNSVDFTNSGSDYNVEDDPGYTTGVAVDLDTLLDSPRVPGVIDARWGDIETAVEEECVDYKPNLFRKGFCMNCQKQHDASDDGSIRQTKTFKKIHLTPSAHAANAEFNPMALPENSELSAELRKSRADSMDSVVSLRSRLNSEDMLDDHFLKTHGVHSMMKDLMAEYGTDSAASLNPQVLEAKLLGLQAQLEQLQLDKARFKKDSVIRV
ncbi:hypothetical protein H310_14479 [Aphanomyces invadans]|uniref:FYVE-type domain-containing protein n=1 Tax=Aphanomyces invadans TaxID=157072 RepID=A0A024T9K1_9STRA|nr:hypothetical protein H310_14479 [Aphanomyces invadans]ETV90815.1 hypothetical protein H310_14479 [Aphanomyces invadans]|eukprot:XP_008880572.1 hypothetical protein H310_14479 [Aphanomyces invadans]